MVLLLNLKDKIRYRIKKSKSSVFILNDFQDLSDKNQIGRALRELIKENLIIKLGYGVYSKAVISSITKQPRPVNSISNSAKEVLKKLGVKVFPTSSEMNYNNFSSTQIPTGRVIGVKSRITRKISFNNIEVKYERVRA